MKRFVCAALAFILPVVAQAQTTLPVIDRVLNTHILPRFKALSESSQSLAQVAAQDCDPTSERLRSAYATAFDAWIFASHLRFGPTEVDDRAFALAFWPDSRGATPRSLNQLITTQDPIVSSVEAYAEVSIAARGFYAMEFLLFDEAMMESGDQAYQCSLVQTISQDIALTSKLINEDWRTRYLDEMRAPSSAGTYRSAEEVMQEFLKALSTGLQFTSEARLGRPLGTYDRPRAGRAEARRSGRSALHVDLSLTALRDLAAELAYEDPVLTRSLDLAFERALGQLEQLDDPVFAGVSEPQTRFQVEILQQSVETIQTVVRDELGPKLGVAAGFNSLDGD